MYNERKESFSVKEILIQILCIVLFVFLLLWLFPTKSYIKKSNYSGNLESQQVEDALFNGNVQTMKDAAIKYFTTSRLPKKTGETVKITLKEMLDKKLILSFVDGNGKSCDVDNSYVEVVKEENEYQMKVNLACTTKSDYIIVYLGCNYYCDTDICKTKPSTTKPSTTTKPVSEQYKYVKTIDPVCTTSAWSDWTTTRLTSSTNVKVDTKWVTTGSTCYSYTSTYDYKEPETVVDNSKVTIKVTSPYCVNPLYTLSSDKLTCTYKTTDNIEYKEVKKCPTGYVENDKKTGCVSKSYKEVNKTTSEGTWSKPETKVYNESRVSTSTTKYSNPTVIVGVGNCNGCVYSVNYVYDVSTYISGETKETCPSGYDVKVGSKCYKSADYTKTKEAVGCLTSNYKLVKENGSYVCVATVSSLCKKGYTLNKETGKCTYSEKGTKLECPEGYEFTDSTKTQCRKYTGETCLGYGSTGYYMYRSQTTTCTEKTTDVKYSKSKNDKDLINKGYVLVNSENKG